jgi:hypothetical protein
MRIIRHLRQTEVASISRINMLRAFNAVRPPARCTLPYTPYVHEYSEACVSRPPPPPHTGQGASTRCA